MSVTRGFNLEGRISLSGLIPRERWSQAMIFRACQTPEEFGGGMRGMNCGIARREKMFALASGWRGCVCLRGVFLPA